MLNKQIKNIFKKEKKLGFVFLEILIAIALIGIVFIVLLGIAFSSLNISSAIQKENKADSLAKEELEAVRSFRDGTTWANFKNVNFGSQNTYYFTYTGAAGSQWARNSGSETVESFTRNVFFDQVYRDINGNIAPSGTLDDNTIKVTVTVVWDNKTLNDVTYLTNWQNK